MQYPSLTWEDGRPWWNSLSLAYKMMSAQPRF